MIFGKFNGNIWLRMAGLTLAIISPWIRQELSMRGEISMFEDVMCKEENTGILANFCWVIFNQDQISLFVDDYNF